MRIRMATLVSKARFMVVPTSAGKPWAIAVARDLTGSASRLRWHLRWLARPIYKPIEDTNELVEPTWVFKDGKREVGPFRDGTLWDCYAIDPVQSVKKFTAVSFCFERGLLHPLKRDLKLAVRPQNERINLPAAFTNKE